LGGILRCLAGGGLPGRSPSLNERRVRHYSINAGHGIEDSIQIGV